jgi:hypothetical protein
LADNALEVLRGVSRRPNYQTLRNVDDIGRLAVQRWVTPRAAWDQSFFEWRSEEFLQNLTSILNGETEGGALAVGEL